jgi:hypothetical protein
MEEPKQDNLQVIIRLSWWSRAVDEIALCPVEDLRCTASGLVRFFLDLRKSQAPVLPGFADATRLVCWMYTEELQDVARYLIRLHRGRFAALVRGVGSAGPAVAPQIQPVGAEIAFTLPTRFVWQSLEIY